MGSERGQKEWVIPDPPPMGAVHPVRDQPGLRCSVSGPGGQCFSPSFLGSCQQLSLAKKRDGGYGQLLLSPLINLLPALLHSSDARENSQRVTDFFRHGNSGHGAEDSKADQAANEWGRSGKDPNHFRPAGLPSKY